MSNERPPRAFSYTRWSTPEQAKGDSGTRQLLAAKAWAERHQIELDAELTFRDAGISAFDGSNVERGALKAFRRAVEDGIVPRGSYLLVESLDRISRQAPWKAAQLMAEIAQEGVIVVDLSDGGKEYSSETLNRDPTLLLMMVVRFMRANEESALKSSRVAAARQRARAAFASDQPLTKAYTQQLPAWLRWNAETLQIEPISERAVVVQKIFEMADDGVGQHSIAGWLNENAGEPWGKGKRKGARWHRSYVRKVLTNRAVIGVFTPHVIHRDPDTRRKLRKPLEPINHRLPPVVDRELFERVSSRIGATAARGKHAGATVRSVFAGVLKCRHCGGTVTRVPKGEHVYLVCSTANSKPRRCHYETVPYQDAEDAVVHVTPLMIHEAPRGTDTAALDDQIRRQETTVDAGEDRLNELLMMAVTDKSRAARRNLAECERELEAARERLRELRTRRDSMASAGVVRRLEAIEQGLTEKPLDVPKVNRALREAVERIVMHPAEGRLEVYWRHADEPQEVPFHTARFKWNAGEQQVTAKNGVAGE